MRALRFRAWDGKELVEMEELLEPIELEDLSLLDHLFKKSSWFKNYILMQYVGLKDKNGKEIYDSDWVLINGKDKQYVYWHEGDGRWAFGCSHNKIEKGLRVDLWGTEYCYEEYEVIGNLYETQEAKKYFNSQQEETQKWVEGYKPKTIG